ncbi:MAG TPA: hypothetical protein VGF73_04720 [Chthoniobacterales bacterium]
MSVTPHARATDQSITRDKLVRRTQEFYDAVAPFFRKRVEGRILFRPGPDGKIASGRKKLLLSWILRHVA